MRTFTVMLVALAVIVAGVATSVEARINYTKVACNTSNGEVLGADTTTVPGPLLDWPCSFGDNCIDCLKALLEEDCKFTEELPPVFIQTPTAPTPFAVVYHLKGQRCGGSLVPEEE